MRTSLLALLGSAVYATARYHIFRGVPWSDWPTYTLNKAFALAAVVLFVFSVVRVRSARGHSMVSNMPMASLFGFTHVALSLTLLSPAYYEKFFVQGRLTGAAGVSMLLGAVAAAAMAVGKGMRADQDAGGPRNLAMLALVVGLHAMLQGLGGWFAPSEWPGGLPPITLISFLLGLAALAIVFWPRRAA